MKLLCKYQAGSHSYGLATKDSDIDYRGIFVNEDMPSIIGLSKHEHQISQTAEQDVAYTELRNAMKLLRGANTQMVELLYNDQWLELSSAWKAVMNNRDRLVDSAKLFSCLRGYMQGELRLANGERTGKLGGKRKAQIDKFGFSPKNWVQLVRLAWAGSYYFNNGFFPVNIMKHNDVLGLHLLDIKTHPEKYTKIQLNEEAALFEANLVKSFENRKVNTIFDEDLANKLCLKVYAPMIQDAYIRLPSDTIV